MVRAGTRAWVQAHPVAAFPLIYLGWAWLCWLPLLFSQTSVWSWPNLGWFLLGGASPAIAGFGLTMVTGGRRALADLGRRFLKVRTISLRWWLLLLLFWLGFDLIHAGLAVLLGITDSPMAPDWALFSRPGPLLFLLLLSIVFPAVEEVGLRGYYLETLQQHLSPVAAALINGAVWAAWHAPFVLFPGYYDNTAFHPSLWWLPMIVSHTVLIMHVYNRNGGSLVAVLLFHAMLNFTGEWLRLAPELQPFMLAGNLLLAGLVIRHWCGRRASAASH